MSTVLDPIAQEGIHRIEWARRHMGVMEAIRAEFEKDKPFSGIKVGMALHVEAKTAALALAIQAGGAEVRLASCNPDSTDDRVAAALNLHYGLETFAKKGETTEEYYRNLNNVLDLGPDYVIDDGCDLVFLAHQDRKDALPNIKGGCEETTTGIVRLKAMSADGALTFPMMDVNDAKMKHLFDNRYGTGQSTFDGLMHATNLLIAGKNVVVAGYGWCGRGIAMRANGLGANVIVTEVDPVKAIEARLDGYQVMPMEEAVSIADFVLTATGMTKILDARQIPRLKDGAVLANAGHFDNEIWKPDLEAAATKVEPVREGVTGYTLKDGRTVYLVASGRLVNLASGQGHPVEIMDMSFAIQALSLRWLVEKGGKASVEAGVITVPDEIDERVARIKLQTLGITIDSLSAEQVSYGSEWRHGT
ncbi:MAG: adenosylhomocysteinase [Euryarchaeota archaeon]|nr:adenosylhomocysteinase [Euryarchaeota archaeon]